MYCVNCGVKLSDTEACCPLCQTRVYHPDITRPEVAPLYPAGRLPLYRRQSRVPHIIATVSFVLVIAILFMCDFQFDRVIAWSHYAAGGLVVLYTAAVLPTWFKSPHPIVFVPVTFAVIGLYLLMCNICTDGHWFLGFAFPVTGGVGVIATTVATLLVVLRRGHLFVIGGAFLATGAFSVVVEWLLTITFPLQFIGWSWYPLAVFTVVGGLLIFLGICRPARKTMERKMFI